MKAIITENGKNLKQVMNKLKSNKGDFAVKTENGKLIFLGVDPAHVEVCRIEMNAQIKEEGTTGIDKDDISLFVALINDQKAIYAVEFTNESIAFEGAGITKIVTAITVIEPKIDQIQFKYGSLRIARADQLINAAKTVKALNIDFLMFSADGKGRLSMIAFDWIGKTSEKNILMDQPLSLLTIGHLNLNPTTSMFPLDYMLRMLKDVSKTKPIDINIQQDYPAKIEQELFEGCSYTGLIAPRIEIRD